MTLEKRRWGNDLLKFLRDNLPLVLPNTKRDLGDNQP